MSDTFAFDILRPSSLTSASASALAMTTSDFVGYTSAAQSEDDQYLFYRPVRFVQPAQRLTLKQMLVGLLLPLFADE
jgi:hypothetical protein